MWKLSCVTAACNVFGPFEVDKEYSIGRLGCDFLLANDTSVSRKHAVVKATEDPSCLIIKDAKSKFGTFVNDEKVGAAGKSAKHGDIVKFGGLQSVFKVNFEVVIVASLLDSSEKKNLRTIIQEMNWKFETEWTSNVSHIVMNKLTVTVKAICALASQIPIVDMRFIQEWYEKKVAPQNWTNYMPLLSEASLQNEAGISFLPNNARRTLFAGKTFVFLSMKQYNRLSVAVRLASGQTLFVNGKNFSEKIFTSENTCVMECLQNDTQCTYLTEIHNILSKQGQRAIQDCEIGLAIVYCSTERHCNPNREQSVSLVSSAATKFHTIPSSINTQAVEYMDIKQEPVTPLQSQQNFRSDPSYKGHENVDIKLLAGKDVAQKNSLVGPVSKQSPQHSELQVTHQAVKRSREDDNKNDDILHPAKKTSTNREKDVKSFDMGDISKPGDFASMHSSRIGNRHAAIGSLSEMSNSSSNSKSATFFSVPTQTRSDTFERGLKNEDLCSSKSNVVEGFNGDKTRGGKLNAVKLSTMIDVKDHSQEADDSKDQMDTNLPSNLIRSEFASLIFQKVQSCSQLHPSDSNHRTKNFKKFKKQAVTSNALRIIGGHGLEEYDYHGSKRMESFLRECSQSLDAEMNSQSDLAADLFDPHNSRNQQDYSRKRKGKRR